MEFVELRIFGLSGMNVMTRVGAGGEGRLALTQHSTHTYAINPFDLFDFVLLSANSSREYILFRHLDYYYTIGTVVTITIFTSNTPRT